MMKTELSIEELFETPDWFLWRFDGPYALFVRMNRRAYAESIFVDGRIRAASKQLLRIETDRLVAYCSEQTFAGRDLNYIFHIAHCGSTLLARALDMESQNIVYREPATLRQLGVQFAADLNANRLPEQWRDALNLSQVLLGRRYNKAGPAIVKANVPVNFILGSLLDTEQFARGILLYMSLGDYVLSVLKSSGHRQWVRTVMTELGNAVEGLTGVSTRVQRQLTISQAAACLWLAQMLIYGRVTEASDNIKTLDAESFFNSPAATLSALFEWFGQPMSDGFVDERVKGELFNHYSKNPGRKFDNETRLALRRELASELSGEMDEARTWIASYSEKKSLPVSLARPLLSGSSGLMR